MRIHLTAFFVLFTAMHIWASSSAQQITLNAENAPLKSVLSEINKQTGYELWYNNRHLQQAHPVSINFKNASLKEVLDKCFEGQPLSYEIANKTIIIRIKPVSLTDKIIGFLKRIGITGVVKDEQGRPIAGVTIRVKGTDNVAVTNEEGRFLLNLVADKAIIQFSYVGYLPEEVNVTKDAEISMVLRLSPAQLDEVNIVSTGYQSLPKERATGSFSKVDNTLFNRRVSTNILERLEGIVPGLAFSTNYDSTNPRQGEFSVRGLSTIFANSRPLIVVDNFPFDGDLYNLNPNDIESVTVLKDAAAASIWGARSGNGVVVITTKRGSKSTPLKIEFNTNYTLIARPDLSYGRNFIDGADFIEAERFLFSQGYYNATLSNATRRPVVSPVVELLAQQRSLPAADLNGRAEIDQQINALASNDFRNDLQKFIYRSPVKQQYALNLNGGGQNNTYYFSGGLDNIPSILNKDNNRRYSLYSGLNLKPVNNLELNTGINFSNNISENNSLGTIQALGKTGYYPYARLADENGDALSLPKDYRESYLRTLTSTQLLDWSYKPLEELNRGDRTTKVLYAKFNAGLTYTFLPGLNIDFKYQLEKQHTLTRNHRSQETYFTRNVINLFSQVSGNTITRPVPLGGILSYLKEELNGNSFRGQINFNRTFHQDHELTFIAGIDAKELIVNQNNWGYYGYDDVIGTTQPVNYNISYPKFSNLAVAGFISNPSLVDRLTDEYMSYYTNGSYTYKSKYIISGSARIDQSNLFGVNANQKGIPLWSSGLAWIVNKETFYPFQWLPYLKLRATYGFNGNIDKSISAFTTARFRGTSFLTNAPYVEILNPPNPELRWERIGVFNIGLDFGTVNNQFAGTIDYYNKRGKDIMGYGPADPTTGILQYKGNVANIKGSGIDVELNFRTRGNVQWLSTFLLSKNTDEVSSYNRQTNLQTYIQYGDGSLGVEAITPAVGKPVYSIFSYPSAGLDPANGDPRGFLNGEISKDYAALRDLTDINAAVFNGPARPTLFGAFRNAVRYKGATLSANVAYKLNYYFRKPTINYTFFAASWTANSDYTLRWKQPGDEIRTNIPSFTFPLNQLRDEFFQYSDVNVERGDHIRLQDVQLSYDLPQKIIGRHLKSLQIYGYASNLGIIWRANKQKIDPDFVNNQYVNPKAVAFGLRSTF